MRSFQAELTDSDGESHTYYFTSSNLWIVTGHISATMCMDGDFYGHKIEDTVKVEVDELVPTAYVPGAHYIALV